MDFTETYKGSEQGYTDDVDDSKDFSTATPEPVDYDANQIQEPSHTSVAKRRIESTIPVERYLEFFNNDGEDSAIDEIFDDSQLGAVTWRAWEKDAFFHALSTKGRHDIRAISEAIGTKSEAETRSYVVQLQQAFADRQRYAQHAKSVTYADIPAACEVEKELEDELEQAADNLASAQDQYDIGVVRSKHDGLWRIDSHLADQLDERVERHDDQDQSDDSQSPEPAPQGDPAINMFDFKTMLELSRGIFMNTPPDSHISHWKFYTDADNLEPAITVDAAETFYTLVYSLTQRILQTALFLAESRLRSTTTHEYTPARVLKDADVHAALNILGMPEDSFEFWRSFPRRSGVRVVRGEHNKTNSRHSILDYDAVENALSIRASRGRRRSLSSMLSTTSAEDERTESRDTLNSDDEIRSQHEPDGKISDFESNLYGSGQAAQEDHGRTDSPLSDDTSSSESLPPVESAFISRKRRQTLIGDAEDAYLEQLDQSASNSESQKLRELLGLPNVDIPSPHPLDQRPRKSRKTESDLVDWANGHYRSLWELNTSRVGDFSQEPS